MRTCGSNPTIVSLDGNLTVAGQHNFKVANGTLVPPQGTAFPTTTVAGALFWRTDEEKLYRRNDADTEWVATQTDPGDVAFGISEVVLLRNDQSRVKYAGLQLALDNAVAGEIVSAGLGTYNEDVTIPAGVQLICAHGPASATIAGASGTGTRVTMGNQTVLRGFNLLMPADATAAIEVPATAQNALIEDCYLRGSGSAGIGVLVEGRVLIDRLRYSFGDCDTVVRVQGAAEAEINGLLLLSGTVAKGASFAGTSSTVLSEMFTFVSPLLSVTDAVELEGGSVFWSDSSLDNCTNALHVTGDSARVLGRGLRLEGTDLDLKVDPAVTGAEVRLTGCELRVDSIDAPAAWLTSGNATLSFQDEKPDDEGFKVFGELQVGLPEQGRESVFGQGDSYTRGMRVLTTNSNTSDVLDGGNLTDVTAEAASPDDSTFGFQGTAAGNSILMASELSSATDRLKHFGIKVKQSIATIVGAGGTKGSFALEIWNGSQWISMGKLATESDKLYRYADEVFLRASSSEHIRYGGEANSQWAKKTINGQEAYWARIRILQAVTTAPTFEQFKLSTSRTEANPDGTLTHHGTARYQTTIPIPGNVWGETGGVGTANLSVGTGGVPTGWSHNMPNALLNNAGDAIYVQTVLEKGLCTSCPVSIEFRFVPSVNSSNVSIIGSALVVENEGVLVADPLGGIAPVPRAQADTELLTSKAAQTQTVTRDVVAGKIQSVSIGPVDVQSYYPGDMLFIRVELDDDGTGSADLSVVGLEVVGVAWAPGEPISL